jgi:predicted glycoside hydrolase/deacetylase ChbG (UPF0249 family)
MALVLLASRQALPAAETWGRRLGYPAEARVLILYAAQLGMCYETNQAGKALLERGYVQSVGVMGPCPWFQEFAQWSRRCVDQDIGLSLTMTSELRPYRWRPISPRTEVPSLVDADGFLSRSVLQFSLNASREEVQRELEMQIQAARAAGLRPTHFVPHLGALLARHDLASAYLGAARKHWIPAVMVELTPEHITWFREQGVPVDSEMVDVVMDYPLPRLDDLQFVPRADSYEAKREQFMQLVRGLSPGITQIVAQPALESEALKAITDQWQQRVWDAQLLADPEVRAFLEEEGVIFTDWRQMMRRFEGELPDFRADVEAESKAEAKAKVEVEAKAEAKCGNPPNPGPAPSAEQ